MKKGCRTWADVQEQGLIMVEFDLDWSPAMETEVEEDFATDTLIPDWRQPWMFVDKVERPPPIKSTLLCVRSEPRWTWDDFRQPDGNLDYNKHDEFQKSWKTPGSQASLSSVWESFKHVTWSCAYNYEDCDGCRNGEPHDRCEQELSEHYFDDEGQCIECKRFAEYRRRSKRLAKKPKKS